MGTQQGKIMGLEGDFMGWIMGDKISEHSIVLAIKKL